MDSIVRITGFVGYSPCQVFAAFPTTRLMSFINTLYTFFFFKSDLRAIRQCFLPYISVQVLARHGLGSSRSGRSGSRIPSPKNEINRAHQSQEAILPRPWADGHSPSAGTSVYQLCYLLFTACCLQSIAEASRTACLNAARKSVESSQGRSAGLPSSSQLAGNGDLELQLDLRVPNASRLQYCRPDYGRSVR